MFEPLAIGNWTLNAEVRDESRTRNSSGMIGVNWARAMKSAKIAAPSAITEQMYQRARGVRSRSKGPKYTVDIPQTFVLYKCLTQRYETTSTAPDPGSARRRRLRRLRLHEPSADLADADRH